MFGSLELLSVIDNRFLSRKHFLLPNAGDMLVAVASRFPIGQVWIDLVKKHEDSIGLLWALRALPYLQNLGIGSHLISTAFEGDSRIVVYERLLLLPEIHPLAKPKMLLAPQSSKKGGLCQHLLIMILMSKN